MDIGKTFGTFQHVSLRVYATMWAFQIHIYLLSTPLRHLIRLLFIYSCIYVLFIYQALQNPKVYPQIHLDITANTSETRNVYLVKERKVTNENG